MKNIYITPDTNETIQLMDELHRDMYTVSYYCIYRGETRVIEFPTTQTSWSYSIEN